jgi:hypothetical protein
MKKPSATRKTPETQLLELLKQVLPEAAPDPDLAGRIYQAVENALSDRARMAAFEKFCAQVALPDLEPARLAEVREQFEASFGDGEVRLEPDPAANRLAVEVTLPDGRELSSAIPVNPDAVTEEEAAPRLQFVPFPVALAGDPELIWLLGREENLTADEAGVALHTLEGDFWASKSGQRLLRQRVERSFPEFIARVPAKLLREAGLKRHYKEPEPVKIHQPDIGL